MTTSPTGYQQVGEFHEVFGHPLKTVPQENIFNDNPELVKFRISLIDEEINEMKDAYEKNDFIEIVDAIADTMYVVYGAFHVIGVNYDTHCDHSKNIIYSPLASTIPSVNWKTNINQNLEHITSILSLLKLSEEEKSFDNFVKNLCDIISACYDIASSLHIDIEQCFAEVHRSNMTKVCTVEEHAIDSVNWYIVNETRYKTPSYRKSTNAKYWIIYDKDTSKILKSRMFELPNIKSIIGML